MPETLKAVIVDDEKFARELLRALLVEHPGIQVVGEAGSLERAVEMIEATRPDIVFLDVDLRGENGFSLFDQTDFPFRAVFVTAFDKYALRAFEVNALDYLTKPIDKKRFDLMLQRLLTPNQPLKSKERLEYDDRMFLKINDRSGFLKLASVKCVRAANTCSLIWTAEHRSAYVNLSLKEWEESLPEKFFHRVHRSAIVNLEYVERVEEWFNYTYRIHLKGLDEPVETSRRYALRLREGLK